MTRNPVPHVPHEDNEPTLDFEVPPVSPPAPAPRAGGRFRRLPGWAKALIVLGSILLGLSGVCLSAAWMLVHRYESQVRQEDIIGGIASPQQQRHLASGGINLLLLGSDSRQGEADAARIPGQRSDTIMLVHIAASRDKAAVISIPRDSFVNIPPGGGWRGGMNKINAAFAYGGAPLVAKTVAQLTGVSLDGAAIANFAGVRAMVDAVDGVNVCLDNTVRSSSGRVWSAGCQRMDGAAAEEFMRERQNVPGGDFGRMKDQQLVVRAIVEKASTEALLSNPVRTDKLLMTAARSLTIDKSLNLREILSITRGIQPSAVQYATVPYRNADLRTFAGSSVELDPDRSAAMFAAIRDDTIDQWIINNTEN